MRSLLLAAGRGRRAGGPKAWLDFEGKPLLERQLEFLLARLPAEAVGVSVQEAWLERCRALSPRSLWVGADPGADAACSLKALLAAAGTRDWAFVHHVDMPVWEEGLWAALAGAAERSEAEALLPSFAGRRGHPALLSPRAQRRWLEEGAPRLDRWLSAARVEEVAARSAACLENWNAGVPVPADA